MAKKHKHSAPDAKQQEKKAILGELESIKSLLSEDELADIPILNSAVDIPTLDNSDTSAETSSPDDTTESTTFNDDSIEKSTESTDEEIETANLATQNLQTSADDEACLPEISDVIMAPDALPGQQSLFSGKSKKSTTAVVARGENPFLPQHIRDRLAANKKIADQLSANSISSAIKRANATPKEADSKEPKTHNEESAEVFNKQQIEQAINEVLASYLPQIEADLKNKLNELAMQEASSQSKDDPDQDSPS